jgi:hypothetical protein
MLNFKEAQRIYERQVSGVPEMGTDIEDAIDRLQGK